MVTFVAADTNWGKTNLAIMVADENLRLGKRVLVVTSEDDEDIYGRRILARRARVNAARLRDRRSDYDELGRIGQAVDEAPHEPFFVRAIGSPAEQTASLVRRLCERHGIQLVIVDYIQAFRMERRMPDRRVEVNEVARLFTNIVKHLRVRAAGLFFSQLKRLGHGRTKPTKHDLKESGDLENAAESVLIGYRKQNSYRLVVDKGKDGTKNEYELDWDGNACCFLGGKLVEMTATPAQIAAMQKRAKAYAERDRTNGTSARDREEAEHGD
jgi:replicative DNA helicase